MTARTDEVQAAWQRASREQQRIARVSIPAPQPMRFLPFCQHCADHSPAPYLRVCCGCGADVQAAAPNRNPTPVEVGGDYDTGFAPPPGCALLSVDPTEIASMERAWAAVDEARSKGGSSQPDGPAPLHGSCKYCAPPAMPNEWYCDECGATFCSGTCHATAHSNPRRVQHAPPRVLAGTAAAAEMRQAPPPAPPPPRLPEHLWATAAGPRTCTICGTAPAVAETTEPVPGPDGPAPASVCVACCVHRFDPKWGGLRLLLRPCEVCYRTSRRPALFHSSRLRQAMCPQCWAFEHFPLAEDDRPVPVFLYGAGTSFMLHQIPALRPFLRLAVEVDAALPPEPLPPPNDERPEAYASALLLAAPPVADALRPTPHTRHWRDYPQEVIVATVARPSGPGTPPPDGRRRRRVRRVASAEAAAKAALAAGPVSTQPSSRLRVMKRDSSPHGGPILSAPIGDATLDEHHQLLPHRRSTPPAPLMTAVRTPAPA